MGVSDVTFDSDSGLAEVTATGIAGLAEIISSIALRGCGQLQGGQAISEGDPGVSTGPQLSAVLHPLDGERSGATDPT